jgi:hypothetical protein
MKRTLTIAGMIIAVMMIVAFSGLMSSIIPQPADAGMVNHENLVFKWKADVDTGAGAGPIIYPGGDSVFAVAGLTTRDEIRCVLKTYDMAVVGADTISVTNDYTDSVTVYNGYLKPSVWTYGADYFVIYRDLTP